MQWDETEGKARDDAFYGGAGYGGGNSRPDLSNTAFFMEALRDTGLPADDPNLQKALVFVSRCQNLKSEFNDQAWAGKINDGGFIYTAAQGGNSMAGKEANGGLRSYASMTYAGLKSMIYAGLSREDPRVKAALTYITHHYSLDENPGLGQQGLYYYYHTFAKTMSVLDTPTITDAAGVSHDWKAELIAALAKRQQADGSWVNPADRFMEGDPNLVTAYALLALAYTRPQGAKRARQDAGSVRSSIATSLSSSAIRRSHLAQLVRRSTATLRPGPVDRIVGEAGNDVPVAVVDGLARDAAVVDEDIEPLCAGRGLDGAAEPGEQRAGVQRRAPRAVRRGGRDGPGERGACALD